MKIGILGAGITGLTLGKLLKAEHNVEILEFKPVYGGIARTRDVNGIAYHVTGGHCFNSKYPEVLNWVFSEIMPREDWHVVKRNANIYLNGHDVSYPIEFAVKQIFSFDPDLAFQITSDFMATGETADYDNLEAWFRKKFGDTLAELYFIPYNQKIWNRPPSEISPDWVEGKLPIPDKASFFKGLFTEGKDSMPHASFYYPNSNNQNTLIDRLAEGLNITTGYKVKSIRMASDSEWVINDEKRYDLLISTLPLNLLPNLIEGVDPEIVRLAGELKYNRVTTMLWRTKGTPYTWTYVPHTNNIFHRYIHIGNFFNPQQNYSITEVVGERSEAEMIDNGRKDPFLLEPLAYHVSDHAYVVYDENHSNATSSIRNYLSKLGIRTAGRFGEWQYYNMDVCIKSAMDLADTIKKNSKAA
jgi:protoporphyrinogen oxidase